MKPAPDATQTVRENFPLLMDPLTVEFRNVQCPRASCWGFQVPFGKLSPV
jgi:hypothetical protein